MVLKPRNWSKPNSSTSATSRASSFSENENRQMHEWARFVVVGRWDLNPGSRAPPSENLMPALNQLLLISRACLLALCRASILSMRLPAYFAVVDQKLIPNPNRKHNICVCRQLTRMVSPFLIQEQIVVPVSSFQHCFRD